MPSLISGLTKIQRQNLLEYLNYLNTGEIRTSIVVSQIPKPKLRLLRQRYVGDPVLDQILELGNALALLTHTFPASANLDPSSPS
jgi:hypothetical protein